RHTGCYRDWSSDVCSSDLADGPITFLGDQGGFVRLGRKRARPTLRQGDYFRADNDNRAVPQHRDVFADKRKKLFAFGKNAGGDKIGRASCRERGWMREGG